MNTTIDHLNVQAARALLRKMDAPPIVDRARAARAANAARRGKAWIQDLWRVGRGPGKISPNEYFYYNLYDPSLSRDDMVRFVGKRAQAKLHRICNDARWHALCHDKALFYTVLRGAGLPTPETVAVHDARGRSGAFRTLQNSHDLRAFLNDPSNYPLFAKPIDGIYSIGALSLRGVSGTDVTLNDGTIVPTDDLIDFVTQLTQEGYLFQKVLAPDPALAASLGDTLSSIRLLVLWSDGTPTVESAVIKIPRKGHSADNYWRVGNMLGALDLDNGEVYRAVTGHGADLVEVETHPDTGAALKGLRVPQWEQAVQTCLDGVRNFPGVRTQSWDVAITSFGPVLLELNFGGDLNLHQLAHRRGMLGPSYVDHLRRCGYRKPLPQ